MKSRKIIPRELVTNPTPENVFIGGNWGAWTYTGTILNPNVEGVPVYQPVYETIYSDGVVITQSQPARVYGETIGTYANSEGVEKLSSLDVTSNDEEFT